MPVGGGVDGGAVESYVTAGAVSSVGVRATKVVEIVGDQVLQLRQVNRRVRLGVALDVPHGVDVAVGQLRVLIGPAKVVEIVGDQALQLRQVNRRVRLGVALDVPHGFDVAVGQCAIAVVGGLPGATGPLQDLSVRGVLRIKGERRVLQRDTQGGGVGGVGVRSRYIETGDVGLDYVQLRKIDGRINVDVVVGHGAVGDDGAGDRRVRQVIHGDGAVGDGTLRAAADGIQGAQQSQSEIFPGAGGGGGSGTAIGNGDNPRNPGGVAGDVAGYLRSGDRSGNL